jgi:Fic family protein
MASIPTQMEPLFPQGPKVGALEDLALQVQTQSAVLSGMLHPSSQQAVIELTRLINSYYSNLIEGNSTHPIDIEKAMRENYAEDPFKRNLQLESLAHIECQKALEERLRQIPDLEPCDPKIMSWIHETFYLRLPEELCWVQNPETGERLRVVPGEFRKRDVAVGGHVPPEHDSLESFLARFHESYRRASLRGLKPIIAAAASHHRLAWIHPFLDGNGRVARLITDTYLRALMPGYGMWTVSRGLARGKARYMEALAIADMRKRNDLDGRGPLSNEGLTHFCEFFLKTCLDQVQYMTSMLRLDELLGRIEGYVKLRAEKIIPAPTEKYPSIKVPAAKILQEVLLRGEMTRGDAAAACGSPRMGKDILPQLLAEGLLVTNMPKGPVRIAFPPHAAGYLFHELYPMGVSQ